MSTDDESWDWGWLWFAARFLFKFTEQEFWNMTPRELAAFSNEYIKYHSDSEQPEQPSNGGQVFIDQLW